MKPQFLTIAVILLSLPMDYALAYGNSSSSSSCAKPSYSEFNPTANESLQSLSEFSFVVSSNTTASSIEVNISAGSFKKHFSAKELDITQQRSGRLTVKGKLDKPLEQGYARISVTAHSKPGCEKTDGYLIKLQ